MSRPKFLSNFNTVDAPTGVSGQPLDVSSGIRDIYIANVGTVDAIVRIYLAFPGNTFSYLIENMAIPPGVTLDVLEGRPIRVTTGKAAVNLLNHTTTGSEISVTYISQ